MRLAITRAVSPALARCELTHLSREIIDVGRAAAQHAEYERALEALGIEVGRLAADPGLPDSVFVEDTCVVVDELAIITRPGAESRRPETAAVAEAVARDRALRHIEPPGTLDGGDVLRIGRTLFVGRSLRTNDEGIEQLRRILEPLDYQVHAVALHGCLHLKSAVTQVGPRTILVNPAWIDMDAFAGYEQIEVDPAEPFAANALLIGDRVIHPAGYSRTRARLESRGVGVVSVDVSELAKAEGGVTCCSVLFED